jgi:hypothetical protein
VLDLRSQPVEKEGHISPLVCRRDQVIAGNRDDVCDRRTSGCFLRSAHHAYGLDLTGCYIHEFTVAIVGLD